MRSVTSRGPGIRTRSDNDHRTHADWGQALPIVGLGLFLACAVLLVGIRLVGIGVDRARAQTAADAAALAGAAAGPDAARRVAVANGATLRDYSAHGAEVRVVVAVGDAEAEARAERRFALDVAGAGSGDGGVTPSGDRAWRWRARNVT